MIIYLVGMLKLRNVLLKDVNLDLEFDVGEAHFAESGFQLLQ